MFLYHEKYSLCIYLNIIYLRTACIHFELLIELTCLSFPLSQIRSFSFLDVHVFQTFHVDEMLRLTNPHYTDIFHRFCTSSLHVSGTNTTSYDLPHILIRSIFYQISLTTILVAKTSFLTQYHCHQKKYH